MHLCGRCGSTLELHFSHCLQGLYLGPQPLASSRYRNKRLLGRRPSLACSAARARCTKIGSTSGGITWLMERAGCPLPQVRPSSLYTEALGTVTAAWTLPERNSLSSQREFKNMANDSTCCGKRLKTTWHPRLTKAVGLCTVHNICLF